MSWLIFDAVLGIALILAVVQGYRKGFVLTLCGFLAVFVAFFGASVLSNALAGPVADAIRPVVEERLEQAMQKSLEEQGWTAGEGEQPEDGAPAPEEQFSLEQVLELIQESRLFQSFSGALHSAVSQGLLEVTTSAAQAVAGYLAREVARMALFLICFALVLVGWTLLSRVLDLAFRLPVLSTLNHWSGAAVGLGKGCVLLFIACWLFRDLFPAEAVEQSVLLRFFCGAGPLALPGAFF
ncbi:MAG: CvpA family protein [Lawsonibacter sp.]|jgi:hypothetical protein